MKHPIKKVFLAGAFIICILVLTYVVFHKPSSVANENLSVIATVTPISPYRQTVFARVARTEKQQEDGLSNFEKLPRDGGMLFVFNTEQTVSFWMKDMNFPLDIVWMRHEHDDTYEIVSITENAAPTSYPATFAPAAPVDAVLEMNAFSAATFGFKTGGEASVKTDVSMKSWRNPVFTQ